MDLSNANKPQKAAITHMCGPCLVLAGPGSGKTFTITNRILYLLEQGVPPESILVITFMKEAAVSMQNRFREMAAALHSVRLAGERNAGHIPSYPVNFGTFHSVFYHILKESNTLKSNQLLKNREKKNLLLPILKTYAKQQGGQRGQQEPFGEEPDHNGSINEDADKILGAISFYKNTMEMEQAAGKVPPGWRPYFEVICQEYESAVRETGRLDFDDMIYNCRSLLEENRAVRGYWQERFRYILIDEFQDINPVQYEVVKLLAASPYNIFAVGDDDQAIYGFRGSQPECLKRFEAEFQARRLLLDVNYRSEREIVRSSLSVIGENKNRFVKQLRAAREEAAKDGGQKRKSAGVTIQAFAEREEQYAYMLGELTAQLETGETCAVLFRTNSYMQAFASRLKSAGVPYEMKENAVSIYEHFIVKDIMAYLQVAQGKGSREQMLRIMNKPMRYLGRESVGRDGADIRKMREYYERAQLPESQRKKILEELSRFEKQLESVGRFMLRPAIHYILKAMGYERYLRQLSGNCSEKWQEWQEFLEWMKEDASAHADLGQWENAQKEYTETVGRQDGKKDRKQTASRKQNNPTIQLLTVHGAKGLEYDRVWIPDCNEKIFPHGTMPDERSVEEERRIFYVAMTRAKKSLELLYLTGTKERPRLPSRFLNPLFHRDQ